ncbi:hypothetical protein BU25DRAFT_433868 [Macroventuria anomochaeta]|uniref:Uncharacterized protein n=1 Tax=Macroventuria anomochaeta TaxID=301207 RepID=A0ACB6RQ04_9PLEO|nr:uncharacterized protein BU25DRAFT_433868 [Macroventuria anomochaeta]KAF2623792.1 hypothetical protein BU25DRAFT_433868 [Macroventuria anomochaeta]
MTVNPINDKILELGSIRNTIFRSPVTPGLDISGSIVGVGYKANPFQIGDIIFGSCNGVFGHGALAQYVQVSQDILVLAPEGTTTLQAIRPYVKAGDKIFINGGSEGTGVLEIQIAEVLGCHVATSCSTANVDLCKSTGADEALDQKEADIMKQLNGQRSSSHLILANLVGIMMLPGFIGGGKDTYTFAVTKPNRAYFNQLAAWVEKGKICAVVDSVHEFSAASEAFAKLKAGRTHGKL